MKVYLLNTEQVEIMQALNTQAATCVVCDHGLGACIGENDLDPPEFSAHKSALADMGLSPVEIPE